MTSRRKPFAQRRKAVGFSQEGLAERLGVDRSTVVRWEAGDTEPRPWMRPRLARALEVSVGELDGLLRECLQDGKPPDSFLVESHKFIPAYIGTQAAGQLTSESSFVPCPHEWLDCYMTSLRYDGGLSNLYVFACGVVVFHIREEHEFTSITNLAIWRWNSYSEALSTTSQQLGDLIGGPAGSDYVLSLYCLQHPCWLEPEIDIALRLMSVPSVLVNRESHLAYVEDAQAAEQKIFCTGFHHPILRPFGIQGVSLGYASWSGVSYHPLAPNRALAVEEIVSCELTVQALWCYCHHVLTEVENGREPIVPCEYGWRFIRSAHSRLTAARAQETSQHRLMRDAILETSGLPERLRAAQEILRESKAVESRAAK